MQQERTVPYGYCQCGCGERTKIAVHNNAKYGHVAGQPLRYINGHHLRAYSRDRRLSPVDYVIDEHTGCWVWQLSVRKDGYGSKGADGSAHRWYYEQHKGPVPDDLPLDHLCRNRRCVNPDHLEPVTNAENLRRGAHTSLNPDAVREIRASSEAALVLAKRFGVARRTIYQVRSFESWKDIT